MTTQEDEDTAVALMSTLDEFGHQLAMMVPPGETTRFTSENIGKIC